MDLKGRSFLKLMDYTPDEIRYLIDLAAELKRQKKQGIEHDTLKGRNIALIFEKTSTRTRCSFEVAAHDLGLFGSERFADREKGKHCGYRPRAWQNV
jgi:ornithine carbamoyltransferase